SNWHYETANYINGSPAVSSGRTAFGGCDAVLHVIQLAEGKKEKQIDAEAYIVGSAAVVDDMAYIGHYENEFLCIDIKAGKIAWKYKDRAFAYISSPAVTADRVVVGCRDKRLHCLDRNSGKRLWAFRTRGKVDSSPVVADGKVVVGSDDGNLYIISLADGKKLWSYEIGEPIIAAPALANGVVIVGAEDGRVHAFGPAK
ncbi:MAG: PQQ-binding-like beta-propeller repeat protein, partial [Verrucomicrobiota bacterium]|nr:PQQ-binding-like beta-propeller repeat protein [Verrucomicrobiota bacterium]